MDPQIVARLLAFLPPLLAFLWILRMGKLDADAATRRLADLRDFARSQRLTLGPHPSTNGFTLKGTYEGLAVALDTPTVGAGKASRTITRVTLRLDAGSGVGERALIVRRADSVDIAELAGLAEAPSGDAAFDGLFRVYVPADTPSPAESPAFRAACLDLEREAGWAIDRVGRQPDEITVALRTIVLVPPVLERALQLASSLASADRAQRVEAGLATPIVWEDPAEVRRAAWHLGPFVAALAGSIVLGPVLTMANPLVHRLVELVACDETQRLTIVRVGRKGQSFVCLVAGGEREGANLWTCLVGWGLHFCVIAIGFVVVRGLLRTRRTAPAVEKR